MHSLLETADLADRAKRAVADPAVSPYSEQTSTAITNTIDALASAAPKVQRELSMAILVDFEEAEQHRADWNAALAQAAREEDRHAQAHYEAKLGGASR